MNLENLIKYLIAGILPPETEFSLTTDEVMDTTVIKVTISPEHAGQIIGKEGRIIKAIRLLAGIAYPQKHFVLEINN